MASLLSPIPSTPLDPLWRFTVDQYHLMIDAGILPSGSPVELLEGVLLQKMSKKAPNRITTRATRRALEAVVPAGWFVDEQEPITLADSEPEPDVMVARGDSPDRRHRHRPRPRRENADVCSRRYRRLLDRRSEHRSRGSADRSTWRQLSKPHLIVANRFHLRHGRRLGSGDDPRVANPA